MVLSLEPEAILVPSGEKLALLTEEVCPSRLFIYLPVLVSQIFTVPSLEHDTIY